MTTGDSHNGSNSQHRLSDQVSANTTELLSKPIRYGYMNGIALTVLISQVPKLFGFSIDSDGPLRSLWAIGEAIVGGKTNWAALAVGAGALAVILLLKNNKRIPGILV